MFLYYYYVPFYTVLVFKVLFVSSFFTEQCYKDAGIYKNKARPSMDPQKSSM
uniref:Uncharacterized protein n=1 Tax=Anguilla anguilla TaxID=7936 RepID=A0A0E9S2I7_ANGAN